MGCFAQGHVLVQANGHVVGISRFGHGQIPVGPGREVHRGPGFYSRFVGTLGGQFPGALGLGFFFNIGQLADGGHIIVIRTGSHVGDPALDRIGTNRDIGGRSFIISIRSLSEFGST